MKNFLLFSLIAAVLTSGCRNVEYVGQKFDPTPVSEEVVYYPERKEVPPDKYTIIGRFTIHAPSDFSEFEMAEILLEKGREYGGDAVCLVDYDAVQLGAYKTNEAEFGAPSVSQTSVVNPVQTATTEDVFGKRTPMLHGEVRRRTEIFVRALLLKDRETTKKLLETR